MPMREGMKLPHRLVVIGAFALVLGGSLSGCGDSAEERAATDASLIDWPTFGRVTERTHYLPTDRGALDPPLREDWSINTHGLIEFPPAVAAGVAYVVNKFGNLHAIRLSNRRTLWERIRDPSNRGKPTDVTAPVFHDGRVYMAYLDGELVALDAETGKPKWRRQLPGHLESSPVAADGVLYIGSDRGHVYALSASDGSTAWRFDSPGAVKASPSLHRDRVYVADYEGAIFGLDAASGRPVWRTNTTRVRPFGKGGFYSSPAIAFGHVYAARDDGTVYAFDEATGRVEWFFQTNHFIYGSPAVAEVPGTPPSVYIGSYDQHFYALDAGSGKVRWRYDVRGPVPGTATVIGHTVYTSSFKTRESVGLDVRDGRRTFSLDDAGYTPVVSDGQRLYLIGYYELIGLLPKRG